MDKLTRFLWRCSGASIALLEKCKAEAEKYAGIGATVLFTGIFAALAGGYALYTLFEHWLPALIFGLLWGLMIFNLDRFVVSSMRKSKGKWNELKMAAPRILLTLLIAMVIAKPLEMKIFEKEIDTELVVMQQEVYQEQDSLVRARFLPAIDTLEQEVAHLKAEIDTKTSERNGLLAIARQEADGTGGSGKKNLGPIYKLKKADADQANDELRTIKSTNDALITEKLKNITIAKDSLSTALATLERSTYDGLAARIEAMGRLSQKSPPIRYAEWFIFLLFIAVELAPVLVKLLSPIGPYDHTLEVEERVFEVGKTEAFVQQNKSVREGTAEAPEVESAYVERSITTGMT